VNIIPVILSGGCGSRLWPLSRKQYPKQYLKLNSANTMLQDTLLRLSGLSGLSDPIIVCNTDHRFLVSEQLQRINVKNSTIILEPFGRNTAVAIAAAAKHSISQRENNVLLVLPADHVIHNIKAFYEAINVATIQATSGKIVTFGITPTEVNTGYGYIEIAITNNTQKVKRFVEKPDIKTAQSYIDKGNYLWNSGMFMFKAETLIDELSCHALKVIESATASINNSTVDNEFIHLEKESFESAPNVSIDHALMEKSKNVAVVPLDAGWSDVGSWSSLYDISKKDRNGNVVHGDTIMKDSVNTYVHGSEHVIATIGVQDLVIVDTPNATLISAKGRSQDVKEIVENLQKNERREQIYHRKVYRPWGWYDSIEEGKYFKVKKLYVNPGAKLSLQMHNQRAEHWVVVNGTATVVNGENIIDLNSGESTFIPIGVKHSLENKTNNSLEIIEVQSGTYLEEDDIIRFEDIYGRVVGSALCQDY